MRLEALVVIGLALTSQISDQSAHPDLRVILDGIVCDGNTLSILTGRAATEKAAGCHQPITDAVIVYTDTSGAAMRAQSTRSGKFSLGPILLRLGEDATLSFTSESHKGMSLSGVASITALALSPGHNAVYVTLPPKNCPLPKRP